MSTSASVQSGGLELRVDGRSATFDSSGRQTLSMVSP